MISRRQMCMMQDHEAMARIINANILGRRNAKNIVGGKIGAGS